MLARKHLVLLKYIQDGQPLSLKAIARHFHQTTGSIRNDIHELNRYCPSTQQCIIYTSIVRTSMNYPQFTEFARQFPMAEYQTSAQERIQYCVVKLYLEDHVNLSQVYQDLGLSISTKKKDTRQLRELLKDHGQDVVVMARSGIRVKGDALRFRLLLIQQLMGCFELEHGFMIQRSANSPIERTMIALLIDRIPFSIQQEAAAILESFAQEYRQHLSYGSRKFLHLYTTLALLSIRPIVTHQQSLTLQALNVYYFSSRLENLAFNMIIGMLDFYPPLDFPMHEPLWQLTVDFLDQVQLSVRTRIHTRQEVIHELYLYFYQRYFIETFRYRFDETLVKGIEGTYQDLYTTIIPLTQPIRDYLNIEFSESHWTSLTLILSKWIIRNKLYRTKRRKVVLVTNQTSEKTAYFLESLRESVEFELVSVLNSFEIDQLKHMAFDCILTFSNRITSLLAHSGYPAIRIHFFMTREDQKLLLDHGFSTSKRHFLASEFAQVLSGKNQQEMVEWLRKHPSGLFI